MMRDNWVTRAASLLLGLSVSALLHAGPVNPSQGGGPSLSFQLSGPRVIANTNRLKMQLVRQEEGAAPNQHPVDLAARQLGAIIASISLYSTDEGGAVVQPFGPGQAKRIAEALERAFAEAGPDQDIELYSFRQVGGSFLSKRRVLTSARVFYDGETVNMILGEVDSPFEEYKDYTVHTLAMGSRQGSNATSAGAAPGAYQLVQSRNDWIRITPGSPTQQYPVQQADVPAPTGAHPAAARPVPVPAAPAAAPVPAAAPTPRGITWKELEEGLSTLNRLRERGLINDQDYEAKKKEMLDALGNW